MFINKVLSTRVSTCLSQGTRVWRVRVPVVLAEVFGNVVSGQLGHNIGDVAKGSEVLEPFVSTTLWRKRSITIPTGRRAAASAAPTQQQEQMKHLHLCKYHI